MRLAVMFAMHPDANFSLAFAISGLEIVNHQVEHDVDVEAAVWKGAEPMHFDETRMIEQRPDGSDGRVESLCVPDPEHRTGRGGSVDHLLGFPDISRERLLHQHRRAAVQEGHRHGQM
jgi:hypothetical protein